LAVGYLLTAGLAFKTEIPYSSILTLVKRLVKVKLLLVSLALTIAVQLSLQAQTVRGVISGLIKDAAGNPVASASVTITSQETNAKRTATSDSYG
jgi:hypothetical protein